ncbi:ribonuclease HII [Domibacillus sp. DTU_2020_1001157_1_SI_ALB_TIR_016]|uniref:ribonuclease HII n=1 Tax=Domibacillus sp. DTU_2020_1001157_1_SI_ALB_TIR_016 TaxID=3077789 RepID=UPI0028E455AF|nr:ribonuclease HII [Domibacillus sp. DTU_2020_1001157_1_SI_ALB_TIR_016]WNS79744.1 ribonuclease HII [Domibacillus sp. DTU_2020_1001157_1_SI_ALB_TIR_016]
MCKETITQIKQQLAAVSSLEDKQLARWEKDERRGVQAAVKACRRRLQKKKDEQERLKQMMAYERAAMKRGMQSIAGIDEAGRGPLAGPVVAAACILPDGFLPEGLNDSKKIKESIRDELYALIIEKAAVGVGIVSAEEIDRINIYEAAKKAMMLAVESLPKQPDHLLVDAMTLPAAISQEAIIKGDAKSASIAAASIIAKVTRDRLMKEYAAQFPGYGFEKNMGYGTKEHIEGLKQFGVTPQHRKTFAPVKDMHTL